MRKIAPYIVLFLLALVAWEAMVEPYHTAFLFDGDDIDGPFGALAALLFTGGGIVIGVIALLVAALVVVLVCAGVGLIAVLGVALAALIAAAVAAPFLLPLLIPVAIIWYLLRRDRKNRIERTAV